MIPTMTRFWFGVIIAGLITFGGIFTALKPAFPFVAFSVALGGIYTAFVGSKAITDHLICNHNGDNDAQK